MMSEKHFVKRYKKTPRKRSNSLKKLPIIYVSLVLIVAICVTATFSWFTAKNNADINGSDFSLQSANGLRVNNGEDLSNTIYLDGITLDEASSVDGRNMYFPTKGTYSSTTADMFFREGNAGDKNVKYWAKDFTLSSDARGSEIYVQDYSVKVYNQDGQLYKEFNGVTKVSDTDRDGVLDHQEKGEDCPIRIAFIQDSSATPNVIDPSALLPAYVDNYEAVSKTNSTGKPETEEQKAHPFSNYYFGIGDDPIFKLGANESLTVTMVVWLEGAADKDSVSGEDLWEKYADKKITVEVDLESNFDDMEDVYFVDGTAEKWIKNDGCTVVMSYVDKNGKSKTTAMKQINDTQWQAKIPKNVDTNISFYRYSTAEEVTTKVGDKYYKERGEEIIYNSWHTEQGINESKSLSDTMKNNWLKTNRKLQENRIRPDGTFYNRYVAKNSNGYNQVIPNRDDTDKLRLSPCLGYWEDAEGGGGTTTPTQPTTTPTPGGETININISVKCEQQNWVYQRCKEDGYTLYVVFNDGTSASIARGGNNYFEQKDITVNSKASIVRLELRRGKEVHDTTFPISITNLTAGWYNMTINSNGSVSWQ